ncbi:MAG TPA: site-specific DNA-methyltransferase [Bacilli bacterium]|nr:site-specific DNA-methyltransferase [Bacilli bacterium]
MNKLDLESTNIVEENIEKIGALFPNTVVETNEGLQIDFDLLKQELSKNIVEGNKEKYQLTWPGKKEAIVNANTPTTKTLRPLKDKSVDFDNTQNIYIEGDNLEALKILQESYLNKIKCIYIDPPYNTGNDFIYNDNFNKSVEDELKESGQIDEEGNRLVVNNLSNGRFHSDWLSMMYSRLKLARNLLTEDGVIFISIDSNESSNLKRICDDIFGENNFIVDFIWEKHKAPKNDNKYVTFNHEFVLMYGKSKELFNIIKDTRDDNNLDKFKNEDNDPRGVWISGPLLAPTFSSTTVYEIEKPNGEKILPPSGKCWAYGEEKYKSLVADDRIWFGKDGCNTPRIKRFLKELPDGIVPRSILFHDIVGGNQKAANELQKLFDNKKVFDYSKPVNMIKYLISKLCIKQDIILDFFSGSSTTAHSVTLLNSEDNGNRKFIMVQLPEKCDEKTEAFKSGYKTICDIGEERIRRAGKKIKEETNAGIDYGFRVYKIDDSIMKDVYYTPSDINQSQLSLFETNIKEDRTADDILTHVMLDLGLTLDLKVEEKNILNNKVYYVADNSLVACFDENIDINIINEICKCKPLKVVFRELCFKTDNDKINISERIKKLSPETEINVI